ncbi:hypothetical protein EZV73_10330 [Acidaminobacter sp. JC074]|uniref:hypothetical protein n=1 Tax=Acidaminobacter sp. JC074 TaxID=2530199 RepID=UPI001F0FFE56|nr:hypothetical protein [Acidaminobacter sp. JC074]MCH4887972.1 hypothetical protein [Acidaminobacter sp. JC074]
MKKYIVTLLAVCLLMTGCQSKALVKPVEATNNQPVQEEKMDYDSEEIEAWTLDNLLGDEVDSLNQDQQDEITALLDEINKIEAVDFNDSRLDDLYNNLSRRLADFDIHLSFEMEGDMKDDSNDTSTDSNSEDSNPSDDYGFEPWTLESYLGFEIGKLSDEQKQKAQLILDKINKAEENYNEDTAQAVREIYGEMNVLLKSFGLKVPMTTMAEFTTEHADKFSQDQKNRLVELDEKIIDLSQNDPENEALEGMYEELEAILKDAGFDADEVITQLESSSVIYAKFQLKGADVKYVGDKSGVSSDDMLKFNYLVDRAVKVISKDMRPYVEHILINSDGQANVLAYVRQENDELTKWRMVLDIKDAFDEKGNYINEYDETIVHEFGHLLTLNASQMQEKSNGTYENEEGILAKTSYLNEFYQKFWPEIKDDFDKIVDPNNPDTAYEFYEKYQNHFVTDYAATNPEEDIAESFRLFVCFDKPEGNEIKDQKVKWFYQFDDMVKLRETIRTNLGL